MSDSCVYELEDIFWDEFDQSDDHIVPNSGGGHRNENAFQGDSNKKPRHEVIGISSNAHDKYAAKYVIQGKEERVFLALRNRRDTMLEKDSPTHTPEGVFPASRDSNSIKEGRSLASDTSRMSSHCFKNTNIDSIGSEFCADVPIIGDRCAAVDNNSYSYLLGHNPQTDNDLCFFDNDHEDKESSDLLYYGWPDIGNFEDVDRMFRSCDSTFGIQGTSNEDDLTWFSSSLDTEGSNDLVKPNMKFSYSESSPSKNIPENREPSKLINASSLVNDSNIESVSVSYKSSSRTSVANEPAARGRLSSMSVSNTTSVSKDVFVPKEQGIEFNDGIQFKVSNTNHSKNDNNGMINLRKKQSKHHNRSLIKRKGRCLDSCGSYHQNGNLQFKDIKLPSCDLSCHVLPSDIRQHVQNTGPNSHGYLQTRFPHMYTDNSHHPSGQISVGSTLSNVNSENNGFTSISTNESSYASNQVQSMESSHDRSFEVPSTTMDEKSEKLHHQQGFQSLFLSNLKHADLVVQAAIREPTSVQKQDHSSENEVKDPNEVEGVSMGVPADLDSSNLQEVSGLNEISLEATSFLQLQHVMEKLDIRTKLCIRDSLYRLARSAEQRHNHANMNGGDRDEGTKCTGFMDIETNTNPIDRSMAHLLFHRPSVSSVMPAYDAWPLKSLMINGPITNPPVMAEKLICKEETASEAEDKKAADH
ncbi:protein LNK1-like isoform X2 [Cornus florida]|uniref:protein LNK1-like isoform X2 n=1 Tax=Cornus florida TaxID=4283 RepID=UPI002899CB86|nr:protein LNK1-like isoform X2 [Cornus florida]